MTILNMSVPLFAILLVACNETLVNDSTLSHANNRDDTKNQIIEQVPYLIEPTLAAKAKEQHRRATDFYAWLEKMGNVYMADTRRMDRAILIVIENV